MKSLVRISVFVLILSLALPVAVSAQEPSPAVPQSVVYQMASTGSFEDAGDGTYNLVLEGVAETLWFDAAPVAFTRADTGLFIDGWSGVEDAAEVEAVLYVDEYAISLMLAAPAYDDEAGTLSYVATVVEITSADEDVDSSKLEVPEAFEAADLVLKVDVELGAAILTAITEGVRFTGSCDGKWQAFLNAPDEKKAEKYYEWRDCVFSQG